MLSLNSCRVGEILIIIALMKWMSPYPMAAVAVCFLSLLSCDKTKELYQSATDKVKELQESKTDSELADLPSDVAVVNEADGKAVIQDETRLVMLEFYTDT